MTLHEFIALYCTHTERAEGRTVHEGTLSALPPERFQPPVKFVEVEAWRRPHRRVWRSDDHQTVITFERGRVVVSMHERRTSYELELLSAEAIYQGES